MEKADLLECLSQLNPEETAKIIKDLLSDGAAKDSVATAIRQAHENVGQKYGP
jgi:hypothetical protein